MESTPEQTQGFDPDEWPGEATTGSKSNGNKAEQWAKTAYDLTDRDPEICSESPHDAIDPRTQTPVEIKSCQIRYAGGSRGRFQIWDYAHQELLEADGIYIFVVHEPRTEEFTPLFHRPAAATAVDQIIQNWHPIDHRLRPDGSHRTSLGQSVLFDHIHVDRVTPDRTEPDEDEFGITTETEPHPETEHTPTQSDRMNQIIRTIEELEAEHEADAAPRDELIHRVTEATGSDTATIKDHLETLKMKGEIYCPRENHYRVT